MVPLSFSESARFHEAEADFDTLVESVTIPSISKTPFFKRVTDERKMSYTEDLAEIWDHLVPDEMYTKIKSTGHVKSSLAFPLVIENDVIGVFLVV